MRVTIIEDSRLYMTPLGDELCSLSNLEMGENKKLLMCIKTIGEVIHYKKRDGQETARRTLELIDEDGKEANICL